MPHYLKPKVKAGPLLWKWYAWSYLIPPFQAGCNIVERHLKIMQSFVQFPKIHVQAIKSPDLMGGPFMDLEEQRTGLVKALIQETETIYQPYIQLCEDLKSFQRTLQAEATGNSLEPFYARLPDTLNGLVELVYDLDNHLQVLLLGKLVYQGHYTTEGQSLSLSLLNPDKRPFVLSTPRVQVEDEVHLNQSFVSPLWGELFQGKQHPISSLPELTDKLGVMVERKPLLESLFTEEVPKPKADRHYSGSGVKVRYFGHAVALLQIDELSIITDLVISYDLPGAEASYSYADLPNKIDYVLVAHNHQGHVMFETLLQIRHKVEAVVVPRNRAGALEGPSLKLILNQIGLPNVVEPDILESIAIPGGEIMATPFLGEHSDLNVQSKTAHCVKLKDKKFLLAADSNNIQPKMCDYLFQYLGGIDVLFLGMKCDGAPLSWLHGPFLTQPIKRSHDEQRTLSAGSNFDKAWSLTQASKCSLRHGYGALAHLHHGLAIST